MVQPFHRAYKPGAGPMLSPRHRELIQLLASDLTLEEAATVMNIAISTANQHSRAIRQALVCRTMYGAIVEAMRRGLIAPPSEAQRESAKACAIEDWSQKGDWVGPPAS